MIKLRFIVLFLISAPGLQAQTCCSGGVPLASGIGMPPGAKGSWQLSLNYDVNVLKTLKEQSVTFDDQSRQRLTHAFLFQTSYNFTERFSADLVLPWIKQNRTIEQFGHKDVVNTNGLGDAALLVKYQITKPTSLHFLVVLASGPKMPTGRSDLLRKDGIPLNADLQPGSGAWDGIFWGFGAYKFDFRRSMNLSLVTVYSLKGKNNHYLETETYRFGNELNIILSINDNYLIGNQVFDASLSFRYRKADLDQFNERVMPNTGGQWIFLSPRLSYNISNAISINFTSEFPLLGIVEGTQLSPTYRLNAGVFIKIHNQRGLLNQTIK